MKHYLVTRFSIHEPSWKDQATDEWLTHRWPLFERCAASVAAQDCDFEWVLLCHHKMPKRWFDKLNTYFEHCPITVTILRVGRNWLSELQRYVDVGVESIITTRLDSDDMIEPGFLRKVQSAYSSMSRYFVDAPHGYKEVDGKLVIYTERNNPFLSYVEYERPYRTAYHVEHGSRINNYVVVSIQGRQWIQVIHSRNQRNKA